jgi:hypothetical protein
VRLGDRREGGARARAADAMRVTDARMAMRVVGDQAKVLEAHIRRLSSSRGADD